MKRSDITREQILRAVLDYRKHGYSRVTWYLEHKALVGAPFKVIWRALEREVKRGLLEYGTSLHSPWVTREGLQWLDLNSDNEILFADNEISLVSLSEI